LGQHAQGDVEVDPEAARENLREALELYFDEPEP
jgi:predicted RNase H-like HicB family nuclease